MAILPPHLLPSAVVAPPSQQVVSGTCWRIQVLSDTVIRLEWDPRGDFVDGPTQMMAQRECVSPKELRIDRDPSGSITIETAHMHFHYDGEAPSSNGLWAQVREEDSWGGTWRWGTDQEFPWLQGRNLRGTCRTLDTVDGRCELDRGVVDGRGIVSLMDDTCPVDEDGNFLPSRPEHTDIYIFAAGGDFPEAVRSFYRLSGPQAILPRFALGNWWSRYHRYSEEEYLRVMDDFASRAVPVSVAVIDMDWHITEPPEGAGSGWTGYTWDPQLFPNPERFLSSLHSRGLHTSLNLHPADGIRYFEDGYERLATRMGIDPESRQTVLFDPANPEFMLAYFEEILHPLEDQGVDFWWLDWQQGEHTSTRGLDPLWVLNHYHYLDSAHRHGRGLTLSRYCGPGSQRYPLGFSGDTYITWDSLNFQPEFTATASNIGYGWWSHDIGGHMLGRRDPELETRWVESGVFSPIMRLHSSNNPFTRKEPWVFDEPHCDIQEEYLRLRHRLVGYLHSEQLNGREELLPLIRPMYWEHDGHEQSWEVPNCFRFGSQMIVAPATSPSYEATGKSVSNAWLPEGTWVDLMANLAYAGDRKIACWSDLGRTPLFARAGSVIPLCGRAAKPESDGVLGALGRQSYVGVENPDALEILVVTGADGDYELLEDRDSDESLVRTKIHWNDNEGILRVEAAVGDLGSLPQQRELSLRLLGPNVHAELIELGTFLPAQGAQFLVTREAMSEKDKRTREIHRILTHARCEVELLTRLDSCWNQGLGSFLAALNHEDIPHDLRDALTQIAIASDLE